MSLYIAFPLRTTTIFGLFKSQPGLLCLTHIQVGRVEVGDYLDHIGDHSFFYDADGVPQAAGEGVHCTNVGDKHVIQVCRFPTHLGIKVQSSRLQSTLLYHRLKMRGQTIIKTWLASYIVKA